MSSSTAPAAAAAAAASTGISDSVVAFLSAHAGVQGIDFVQSPGVAVEDLAAWDQRESYALPEGKMKGRVVLGLCLVWCLFWNVVYLLVYLLKARTYTEWRNIHTRHRLQILSPDLGRLQAPLERCLPRQTYASRVPPAQPPARCEACHLPAE